jgi:hypothetical protein
VKQNLVGEQRYNFGNVSDLAKTADLNGITAIDQRTAKNAVKSKKQSKYLDNS